MTDNKIIIAIFVLALSAMEYTSGIGREAFKAAWLYFLNIDSATQTLLTAIAAWSVLVAITSLWW